MVKVRAHELRSKTKSDLQKQLKELKEELATLRVSQHTNGASAKLVKIGAVRKSIARVLTVYNQLSKDTLRRSLSEAKVKPVELREKKTRAIRRRLTKAQASAKTLKQKKKEGYYPKRVYAIKAV